MADRVRSTTKGLSSKKRQQQADSDDEEGKRTDFEVSVLSSLNALRVKLSEMDRKLDNLLSKNVVPIHSPGTPSFSNSPSASAPLGMPRPTALSPEQLSFFVRK
jgi:hypothetical protein